MTSTTTTTTVSNTPTTTQFPATQVRVGMSEPNVSHSHSFEMTPQSSPRGATFDQGLTSFGSVKKTLGNAQEVPVSPSRGGRDPTVAYRRPSPPRSIPVTIVRTPTNRNRSPVAYNEKDGTGRSPGSAASGASDYDNMNGLYDPDLYPPMHTDTNAFNNTNSSFNSSYQRSDGVTVIPISRSDGFVSNNRNSQTSDMVILNGGHNNNGHSGQVPMRMKMARTENDIQRPYAEDRIESRSVERHNGIQIDRQSSYQMSEASVVQTAQSVYSRRVEKTAYL